ncbi:hypothetical protein ACIKP9_04940 [Methylobacillus methanolivorans]|uniref:Uncharacterized protein n=1 Tax=Methylobacillus methanolivorans TaxID=1848927 RepID=A0ABW8GJL9_9PROT
MSKPVPNPEAKPESLLSTLLAVLRLGLMLIGIIGLAVHLFNDEGWLDHAMTWIFSSTWTMLAIPGAILVLYLANRWLTTPRRGELSKRGDIPMYAMMAIGLFFVFRLATTGSF